MRVLEQMQRLSDERFLAMYEALSQRGIGPLDLELAKRMKFRPQAISKVPMATRAKQARAMLAAHKTGELAYEFFGTYLLRRCKELVTGFLDATGVEHKDGMIEDLDRNRPDAAKVAAAVEALDKTFDREDVTIYLSMCAEQWPDIAELDELWRSRLGATAPA
jgi:hypothetical protein